MITIISCNRREIKNIVKKLIEGEEEQYFIKVIAGYMKELHHIPTGDLTVFEQPDIDRLRGYRVDEVRLIGNYFTTELIEAARLLIAPNRGRLIIEYSI